MPLVIPVLFAFSQFFMIVVSLYMTPKKVGMGFLFMVLTATPYYLIFVKKFVWIKQLNNWSGKPLKDF